MKMVDLMFASAIIAATLILLVSLYLQKIWRIFDLLIGKKHAFTVFLTIQIFALLEIVGVAILVAISPKDFARLLPLGLPLAVFCIYKGVELARHIGKNAVLFKYLFSHATKVVSVRDRAKLTAYVCGVLISLMIGFGQFGYLYGAIVLVVCSSLTILLEQKILAKHKQ